MKIIMNIERPSNREEVAVTDVRLVLQIVKENDWPVLSPPEYNAPYPASRIASL